MLRKKDLLILTELRQNSRETLTRISKRTSIPVSTIFDKMKYYQGDLIKKHTILIDFTKLGFNARANIMVKVGREEKEEARKFLIIHQNVNSVYKISNGFDFLVEGIFKNVRDVEDFIDVLSGKFKIEQSQVYYVVEDIKKESFMNNRELLDMVVQMPYEMEMDEIIEEDFLRRFSFLDNNPLQEIAQISELSEIYNKNPTIVI